MGLVSLEPARGAATQFLALDAAGKIWPTRADGTAASEGFTIRDEEVVGLSAGRNGTIYATTRSSGSPGPSFSIFRLDHQSR